jgi:hypothetical protein
VKEKIDRMLEVGIIEPVAEPEWIILMVIQDKKTSGIRICMDCEKLNDAWLHELFPTRFIDEVLENVGHEITHLLMDSLGITRLRLNRRIGIRQHLQ